MPFTIHRARRVEQLPFTRSRDYARRCARIREASENMWPVHAGTHIAAFGVAEDIPLLCERQILWRLARKPKQAFGTVQPVLTNPKLQFLDYGVQVEA